MTKKIRTSNLAIRFYKSDGWNQADVESYIFHGHGVKYFDDPGAEYWVPSVNTVMDVEKLIEDGVLVHRGFNDYPHETDLAHLQRLNW